MSSGGREMKEKGIVIVAICLLIVGGMYGCIEEEKEENQSQPALCTRYLLLGMHRLLLRL